MKRNSRVGDLDDEDGAASVVVAGEGLVDVEEDNLTPSGIACAVASGVVFVVVLAIVVDAGTDAADAAIVSASGRRRRHWTRGSAVT